MSLCACVLASWFIEWVNLTFHKNISQHTPQSKVRKIGQMAEEKQTMVVLNCARSLVCHHWSCLQLRWL